MRRIFARMTSRFCGSARLFRILDYRALSWPAVFASCLFIAMVFWRTGVVPIASGGDDVYASESGYWYLKDGVLQLPMYKNAVSSDVRDFYPPTPSVIQAASFAAFGVNQFSMEIGPSIAVSLLVIAIVAFGYYLRLPLTIAACSGIAAFAIPDSFKRAVTARFDIYVCFFIVLTVIFLTLGRERRYLMFYFASGVFLALSVVSYYPFGVLA